MRVYHVYQRIYIRGVHVLQDSISDMICPTGRLVLPKERSYWCACITGSHALLKGMSYR